MQISQMTVEHIDHMGSDLTVVNAARVSMHKEHSTFHPFDDARLIAHLAREGHWTPFAHCQLQVRVKAPIFVARQLAKHQVGLVWNEVSRRYVSDEPEFWWPEAGGWRGKPVNGVKQGSHGEFKSASVVANFYATANLAILDYRTAIERGMAPEQARMILPQNMMTEWYWTGSLYAFARICWERLAENSQPETAEIAEIIDVIAAEHFPVSWAALMGRNEEDEPEVRGGWLARMFARIDEWAERQP